MDNRSSRGASVEKTGLLRRRHSEVAIKWIYFLKKLVSSHPLEPPLPVTCPFSRILRNIYLEEIIIGREIYFIVMDNC